MVRSRTAMLSVAASATLLVTTAMISGATSASTAPPTSEPAGTAAAADGPCPGTVGCIPAGQPDVNGDGQVVIGVLSPGDTNDNGYYEGLVATAQGVADEYGWDVIILDRVPPAEAAEQTRSLCEQGADLVAITDSQLADALPVSEEEVCAMAIFYQNTNNPIELTGHIVVTQNDVYESQLAAGYATGLVMRELGITAAGFVSGPDLDFVQTAFASWSAGISAVVPDATFTMTLTGSMDDSALGQEAVTAQIGQGAGIMYPYLGGASNAAVSAANSQSVLSVAPGTDRCEEEGFGVSSIFGPGEFFAAVLEDLNAGTITLGEARVFHVGADSVPTAIICERVENAAALQEELDAFMAQIGSGEIVAQEFVEGEAAPATTG